MAQQIKGKWRGYYAYGDPGIAALRGLEKTYFDIEILDTEQRKFKGTVQDDVNAGMTEQGRIEGELDGGFVWFKKHMPVRSLVMPDGKRVKKNNRHPVIHYKGEFFPLEKRMHGTWRIRKRLYLHKFRLYITGGFGTWEMYFTDHKN